MSATAFSGQEDRRNRCFDLSVVPSLFALFAPKRSSSSSLAQRVLHLKSMLRPLHQNFFS